MIVNANLNIHYTAPDWVWEKIAEVYRIREYYDETSDTPLWTGEGINIEASVEPSGIQFYGDVPEEIWDDWFAELKEKLSDELGYEIGEPEDGYEFKYDWDEE